KLDPGYAFAYYNLGATVRDMNRLEEAEAAYRKAIELDPEHVVAYNNLSNLLRLSGREAEALTFAEKAIRLKEDTALGFMSLAAIHKKLGNSVESKQYAEQARKLVKSDDWYNLACLESIRGNTDSAIKNLRQAAQQPTFKNE